MNFEKPPQEGDEIENVPKIPKEMTDFWELLAHMNETQSNPNEHVERLTKITKSLSENDPEFNKIFEKHKSDGVVGMMDALEEYATELTEPENNE